MTFEVGKDFETPHRAGAGGFQVDTLIDENGIDETEKIDVGIIFQDDHELRRYLSTIFRHPASDIYISDL